MHHFVRLITLAFFLLGFSGQQNLQAQDYQTAIGLRAGSATGLSFKTFTNRNLAVEGLLVYRRNGVRTVALIETHIPLGRNSDTYLFFGGGGHIGYNNLFVTEQAAFRVAGIDAVAGIEFTFPRADMSLALDVKPMYELWGGRGFSGNNGGVSLRFWL